MGETDDLKRKLAALEAAVAELSRSDDFKNRLLRMVSHDLRNSIGNIIGLAQLLLEDSRPLDPEQTSAVQDIFQQAVSTEVLLNDLLVMSQAVVGQVSIAPKSFRFQPAMKDILRRHQFNAQKKRAKLVLEPTSGEEVPGDYVFADPHRFQQIMDNLISNAIKYSPPGSTIFIRSKQAESGWTFWVQDLGPGISPEDREKLFRPFSQLSARPTAKEKSVGLGLSITKQLVEAHGGTISADNVVGRGALFWFSLPRKTRPATTPA
jgi:two-component system, sensor histidine kinase and response regulator